MNETAPAEQGHNRPPEDADPLVERLSETTHKLTEEKRVEHLIEAVERVPDDLGDDDAPKAADLIKMLRDAGKAFDDTRKDEKEPFLESGRKVDRHFKFFTDRIGHARKTVQAKLDAYYRRKHEAEEKARREAEEKARQEEQEAQRRAAEAQTLEEQSQAEAQAQAAHEAAEKAATGKTEIRSNYGTMAGGRTVWSHEIVDPAKLPDSVLQSPKVLEAIDKVVGGMVRAGVHNIPGVRVYSEQKAVVR